MAGPRVDFCEGPEEPKATGDHHVAEGGDEDGLEAGASEAASLGAGDGDDGREFGGDDVAVEVEGAVAFAGEHFVVGEGAIGEALGEGFDLGIADFAGVVFEERGDGAAAEVEAEQVHVAEVEDERFGCATEAFVVKGAEGGGRTGVHEGGGGFGRGGGDGGAGAGEVGREVGWGGGEGEEVVAGLDDAGEVLEAEDAVGGAGRCFAVVEAADGDAIEGGGHFEGGEGGADGIEVEVAEDDGLGLEADGFVVADDGDAEFADSFEVVIEGAGGVGCGEGG